MSLGISGFNPSAMISQIDQQVQSMLSSTMGQVGQIVSGAEQGAAGDASSALSGVQGFNLSSLSGIPGLSPSDSSAVAPSTMAGLSKQPSVSHNKLFGTTSSQTSDPGAGGQSSGNYSAIAVQNVGHGGSQSGGGSTGYNATVVQNVGNGGPNYVSAQGAGSVAQSTSTVNGQTTSQIAYG